MHLKNSKDGPHDILAPILKRMCNTSLLSLLRSTTVRSDQTLWLWCLSFSVVMQWILLQRLQSSFYDFLHFQMYYGFYFVCYRSYMCEHLHVTTGNQILDIRDSHTLIPLIKILLLCRYILICVDRTCNRS